MTGDKACLHLKNRGAQIILNLDNRFFESEYDHK